MTLAETPLADLKTEIDVVLRDIGVLDFQIDTMTGERNARLTRVRELDTEITRRSVQAPGASSGATPRTSPS